MQARLWSARQRRHRSQSTLIGPWQRATSAAGGGRPGSAGRHRVAVRDRRPAAAARAARIAARAVDHHPTCLAVARQRCSAGAAQKVTTA
jgi:hypothetical protein